MSKAPGTSRIVTLPATNKRRKRWICHYYCKVEHICPFCFHLYGRNAYVPPHKRIDSEKSKVQLKEHRMSKHLWRIKNNTHHNSVSCNSTFTSVHSSSKEGWCFDSGCFVHMTWEKNFLTNLKACSSEHVIYGDSDKGRIIDKGKLQYVGLPPLSDVILVEDLTVNLISISQLYDQGLNINFLKDRYLVTDSDKTLIMTGTRSYDHYYLWTPNVFKLGYNISKHYVFVPYWKKNAKIP